VPYSGVSRDVAIAALRASKVGVSIGSGDEVTLAKDELLETLIFPPILEKNMLFRLKYRYGVPIHWFFHPEMIPGYEPTKVN